MSKTKFTPGPWEVMTTDVSHNVWSPEGILTMTTSWHRNDRKTFALKGEALANARLTAAAPDLYAAITRLSEVYDQIWVKMSDEEFRMCREAWGQADAALAKAEGRT